MTGALVVMLLAAAPEGTVTLPLAEARTFLSTKDEPAAPISAAVVSQRPPGQGTGEALDVTAGFQVTVLDGARWSRLSLMRLDPSVTLIDATSGDGMLVTAHQGEVAFVSRTPGTYSLELRLSVRGTGAPVHVAQLTRGADAREGVMHV